MGSYVRFCAHILLALTLFAGVTSAPLGQNVLPADRLIDWSQVGIPGGIPSGSWPLCTTAACTAVATPTGNDDTAAIQAAINSAPAQTVVKLGSGTYRTLGMIRMKSNVVLRGNGPGATIISYQGPTMPTNAASAQIIFEVAATSSYDYVTWQGTPTFSIVGGMQKSSSRLQLSGVQDMVVGSVLHLTQLDDPALVVTCGYCGYDGNREIGQFVEVTAVDATTNSVSIYPSLYMPYSASLAPTARLVSPSAIVKRAGVESLTLTQVGNIVSDNILMRGAQQSWVKNVEITYVGYYWGGIRLESSFQNEIRNNFIHGLPPGVSPDHAYTGINVYQWASGNRIENNIISDLSESEIVMTSSGGNVVAYNYLHNNIKPLGYDTWMLAFPVLNHGAHPVQNLWESNVGGKSEADITHGSSSHNVLYRCRSTGYDTNYVPTVDNAIYAVDFAADNKYSSVIGCVLGTAGYSTHYEIPTINDYVRGRKYIWALGVTEGIYDPTVAQTTIRWGNYDYVTNSTHWGALTGHPNEIPPGITLSQTLPASLYLTSPPPWWTTSWGTPAWPAIGPDVTGGTGDPAGHVHKIPAQRCFENQNLASGGAFNPSVCYTNDGGTGTTPDTQAPSTPTGVTASSTSPTQITVSWSASTDNIGVIVYNILRCQGASCAPSTQVGTSSTTTYADTGLSAGTTYRYAIIARDAANNPSIQSNIATATTGSPDTTPPTVSITSPTNGAGVSGTVTVTASAFDNLGIGGVTFFVNNIAQGSEDTSSPYSFSWNTAGLSNGTYMLSVRVRDTSNNLATSSIISVVVANAPAPPTAGLVAAYSLNEGSGTTATDASGNGNTATLSSGPAWVTGKYGSALSYDGVDDKLLVPTDIVGSGATTISAWLYLRGYGENGYGYIIENGYPTQAFFSGPRIAFTSNQHTTVALSAPESIPLNQWVHVAITRTATGTANVYVNGILSGSADQPSGTPGTSPRGETTIGNIFDGSATFDGIIDEFRVYDRTLSAAEVVTDMNTPITTTISPPATSTPDVNGDHVVNVLDVIIIASDIGKTAGYNPRSDQNNDGTINILDITRVVSHWGTTYP